MNGETPQMATDQVARLRPARLVVLMGVAGCGKTSVGEALAADLAVPFLDGDDYHPAANVAKMSRGIPLTDEDRWPWLDILGRALTERAAPAGMAVAGCSALRRAYRDRLIASAGEPILFVLLDGDRDLIMGRMAARKGHYMPTSLLDSQIAILEPPHQDENALTIHIGPPVPALAATIKDCLRRLGAVVEGKQ